MKEIKVSVGWRIWNIKGEFDNYKSPSLCPATPYIPLEGDFVERDKDLCGVEIQWNPEPYY